MGNLLATKPLEQLLSQSQQVGEQSLRRTLGPLNLISLGIGAIIGAGIFVITGTAAAQNAGPAIVISFLLAGTGCVFAGFCYAEFASLIPIAGSAYTYGYATLGEIFAWIIGWDLIIEYAFGAAAVSSGWSGIVNSLLRDVGISLPPQLIATPGTKLVYYANQWQPLVGLQTPGADLSTMPRVDLSTLPQATGWFDLLAVVVVALVTFVLILGVRESANVNAVIVAMKVGTILVFIGLVSVYLVRHPEVASANWTPFIPPNTGTFGEFGWSGIGRGAAVIFFAYIGFDAVSTAAQESRNPQRDMPIGILGSLAVCTVLYILMGGLLTAVVHYTKLNVAAPVAIGIDATGVRWGSAVVKLGAFAGLSSTMVVMLMGQSRIFYTMAQDGLLPPWVGTIHPRFRTPWIASVMLGLFVAFFAALVPISDLGRFTSIGTLFAFVIVCAGVWVLRKRRPDLPRPFKAPFVPLTPILGILISLGLMASLPWTTWARLIAWLALGLLIYAGYGRKHSRLQQSLSPR